MMEVVLYTKNGTLFIPEHTRLVLEIYKIGEPNLTIYHKVIRYSIYESVLMMDIEEKNQEIMESWKEKMIGTLLIHTKQTDRYEITGSNTDWHMHRTAKMIRRYQIAGILEVY